MRVKVAGTAGFCWGVQRALRLLDGVEQGGRKTATFGPLVFNGPVLMRLQERGIPTVEHADQVGKNDLVALRPHGTLGSDRRALEARGAEVLDLTCPHLAEVRGLVLEAAGRGRNIVVAGNREHDEVRTLLDGVATKTWSVATGDDARTVVAEGPLTLVCQSTLGHAIFEDIEEGIRERFPDTEVLSTRCCATEERQEETLALAAESDVLVIVGPYHSGNARRLAEMGRETGKQTFHVETPEDIPVGSLVEQARLARRQALMEKHADDPDKLMKSTADPEALDREVVIGVTGGASTPPWVLRAVVDHLVASTRAELLQGLPKDLASGAGRAPGTPGGGS
jgi:4-hydroxy-3-methylbut-2-enyl diphosphate reductase